MKYDGSMPASEWQKKARKELSSLIGIDEIESFLPVSTVVSESECELYKEIVIRIETERNFFTTATLRVPAGLSAKAPLAVYLVGKTEDLDAALKDEGSVSALALGRGMCFMALEQRNFNSCFAITNEISPEAFTRTTWCECFRSSMRSAMIGRSTVGDRVWDLMRTLDVVLANYCFIDADNISVIGYRGNGTTAYYAAAVDERISSIVVCSSVCSWNSSLTSFNQCSCHYVPNIVNSFNMGDIGGLIAPRRISVLAYEEDEYFPLEGVSESYEEMKKVYSALGADKACELDVLAGDAIFDAATFIAKL